uniref:Uncharacterized protein n=1 Tax=Pristhesancus plagipennis TaxID=1955184 RepID=A0A2K8JMI2_PRIPG|nr:secreted hypothetical protein [Pristhesancus plagipennis]
MKTWSWILLSCLYLVNSTEEEKNLAPLQWKGGLTKMDETGRKAYNGLTTRAQISDDVVFLCNPRLKPGIEATLLKVSMYPNDEDTDGISMEPFPNLKFQTEGDCECLQSAVDLYLDHEDILWVLDVGVTFSAHSQPTARCPPKVVGFNIHNGKAEKVISLANMVGPMSRLQFIVCDHSTEGKRFLYIADAGTKSIIVWDVENNKGVRVALPENVLAEFSARDVLYIALIRRQSGNNLLYFTYRSGENLFRIEAKHLQTEASTAKASDVGKKPSKMIILGTDEWESIYFRYENKADVYKWNTNDAFNEKNFEVVHRCDGTLVPTHAIPDYKRGVMKMVESNLLQFLAKDVTPADAINSLTVMTIPTD